MYEKRVMNMRGQTYVILTIIFIILIAIFAVMNVDSVHVNYLFWTIESPLILVILFSVLMGGLVTATVGAIKVVQLQRENKSLHESNINMREKLKKNNLLDEKPIQSKKQD